MTRSEEIKTIASYKGAGPEIEMLRKEVDRMEKEIKINDELLTSYRRVLYAVPECPIHGVGCVPYALDWIESIKKTDSKSMCPICGGNGGWDVLFCATGKRRWVPCYLCKNDPKAVQDRCSARRWRNRS